MDIERTPALHLWTRFLVCASPPEPHRPDDTEVPLCAVRKTRAVDGKPGESCRCRPRRGLLCGDIERLPAVTIGAKDSEADRKPIGPHSGCVANSEDDGKVLRGRVCLIARKGEVELEHRVSGALGGGLPRRQGADEKDKGERKHVRDVGLFE